jgi:hypothetical protein
MSEVRKQVVVISRHWNSPHILVTIKDDSIALECSLDSFIEALIAEIKSPVVHVTRSRQAEDIRALKDVVLNKIKEASIHAI